MGMEEGVGVGGGGERGGKEPETLYLFLKR